MFEYTPYHVTLFTPSAIREKSYLINDFYHKTIEDILFAFQSIPPYTERLDLSENDLYLWIDEIIKAFHLSGVEITSLDLSNNCLGIVETSQLSQLFSLLSVAEIDLNGNELSTNLQIGDAFKALTTNKNLISVNLGANHFNKQPIDLLCQIIDELPPSLEKLVLSENYLGEKKLNELETFCAHLSRHRNLKTLDLHNNFFDEEQIEKIKKYLHPSVNILFGEETNHEEKQHGFSI